MNSTKSKFFPLTLEDLRTLSNSTTSGIVLREGVEFSLGINYSALPVNSKTFRSAINEELMKRVLKYNSELNDMVLKYSKVRFRTPVEATRSRKLFVNCSADVYVFKPQCENVFSATVNKKSKNHIGCLMYNVFNVSIIKPSDLPYDHWSGRDVEVNDTIAFKVVKVDVRDVIPYIIGELATDDSIEKDRDSGTGTDLDIPETRKPKKSKKRKHSCEEGTTSPKNEPKKSKKRKHSYEEGTTSPKKRKLT